MARYYPSDQSVRVPGVANDKAPAKSVLFGVQCLEFRINSDWLRKSRNMVIAKMNFTEAYLRDENSLNARIASA